MKIRSLYSLGAVSLLFALAGPSGGGAIEVRGTSPAYPDNILIPPDLNSIVGADFDGDMKPDVIVRTTAGKGYVLQIHFSTQIPSASLVFDGAGPGMRIVSRDLNRDNDEDLIVTNCTSPIPVAVFLGDGKGHFQPENPWNYIPVGLNSSSQFDSPKGHEDSASNTEDGRFSTSALCGVPSLLKLNLRPFPRSNTTDPAVQTAGFACGLRGPPSTLDL